MDFYIKYTDTSDSFETGHECTVFYEIINNYATRQLILSDGKFVGSNRKDNTLDYFLAEYSIRFEDFENSEETLEIISRKEFEEMWWKHCENYKNQWIKSKDIFKIGMKIQGEVQVIYPQGVLIKVDENTIAIVDYDECINNSSRINLSPHQYVTGIVKGYDEINMWVILEEARIQKKDAD